MEWYPGGVAGLQVLLFPALLISQNRCQFQLCLIQSPHSSQGSGPQKDIVQRYELNVNCLLGSWLNIWPPAGGTVWEGCGTFEVCSPVSAS